MAYLIKPGGSLGLGPAGQPESAKDKAIIAIALVCFVVVIGVLVATGIAEFLIGIVLAPIVGTVIGVGSGLSVGSGAARHFFSWILVTPTALAGVLGALAGGVTAWLSRVMEVRRKLDKSFVATLFSAETWEGNGLGFLCRLAVGTLVGYVVAAGFASIASADPGSANALATSIGFGGGSGGGGGFKGDLSELLAFLFAALAFGLITAGIIAGCAGGIAGAIIGAGFSSVGVSTVIQGAAEGAVFRFFAPYRPKRLEASWFIFLMAGAAKGAAEGIVNGALVGVVLVTARMIGVGA